MIRSISFLLSFVLLVVMLAPTVAATPLQTQAPSAQTLVLLRSESSNPREYDPATMHHLGDGLVFSGLVSFDRNLKLIPDLAESWQTADGITYTFKLRSNARFHDGHPVTAQDFICSWERAADPKTQSNTVLSVLGDIVGVKEMHAGKTNHIAGIQALNATTLQVTLDAPKPYFLLKLASPAAFVVDHANVDSGSDWYRKPNGTGPYRLISWTSMKDMQYQRNDSFLPTPAFQYLTINLTGNGIRLYETGGVDIASVGSYDLSRVQDPKNPLNPDLRSTTNLCTSYAAFDVTKPPFDDVNVRRAFALAFNRQQYLDVVLRGAGLPAKGILPPGMPGYNPPLKGSLSGPQGLLFDPKQALASLKAAAFGGPPPMPIVYTTSGSGSSVSSGVAAQIQMWQQILEVKIRVENLEPDRYLDELAAGHHGQIFSMTKCADYPDPENFLDLLFHTGAEYNWGHYSNPQVDKLLDQARVESDVTKRIQLYQQVESLIVEDAPAVFIVHSVSYQLVNSRKIPNYMPPQMSVPLNRLLQ